MSYPASRARGADRGERPSRWPAMVGAAAMGAVVGGLVGSSACDDLHETDQECEDRTLESALIGGGVGVLLGAALTAE